MTEARATDISVNASVLAVGQKLSRMKCAEGAVEKDFVDTGIQTSNQVVHEDIIKEMECPVCFRYMVSEIFQCTNGHSICDDCRKHYTSCPQCKGSFSAGRNRLAESISCLLLFPCFNVDAGCADIIPGANMKKHELVCNRRKYECFMDGCQWVGRNNYLLDHFKVEHNACLLLGHENAIVWRNPTFDTPKKMCYLFVANEELFIHVQEINVEKSVLAYCMMYIGQKENAENFYYTLEITKNDYHKVLVFDSVLDDTRSAKTVFEAGESLQVAIPYVKGFLDDGEKLVQKLKIAMKK